MKFLKWLDELFEETLLAVLLVLIACVELLQVVFRNLPFVDALTWAEEFCRFCWVWSVFLSLPFTIRKAGMLRVNVLVDLLPQSARKIVNILTDLVNAAVMCVLFRYAVEVVSTGALFLGGIFPGILIGLFLMAYAAFYCKTKGEDRALNGDSAFTKALREAYEAQNMHLLGFLQNAAFRLTTSNRELKTLEDFKGLQIRTMENANHMEFWQAIGAQPTPLAWAEVYFSLQSGAIDAEENAADTVLGSNLQEVQKYLAFTNHVLYCNQICISKEAWDALV